PSEAKYVRGIQINIERYANSASCAGGGSRVTDGIVNLTVNDIISGNNESDNFEALNACSAWHTSDNVDVYGDSEELWGLSWDIADIADIGVAILCTGNIGDEIAYVDHISITVHYQEELVGDTSYNETGS